MECGNQKSRTETVYAPRALYALVAFLGAAMVPAPAYGNASVFVNTGVTACGPFGYCTTASMFGLLVGTGDTLSIAGGASGTNAATSVLNDIALGHGAVLNTSGSVTVGSSTSPAIVDFADSLTGTPTVPCTGTNCKGSTGSTFSSATTVWGGTRSDQTTVDAAAAQFTALAAYWNAHTGYSVTDTTVSGQVDIGTNPGIRVYSAPNLSTSGDVVIGCGANLALACDPSALLVVLVSGTVNINRNVTFAAASHLTDDQVLFLINATGTGNGSNAALQIGGKNNASLTVRGDFFLPSGNFTLGSTASNSTVDFYGRIFANSAQAGSTDAINPGVRFENEAAVPEPATWTAMIGGVGLLVYLHRRRKRVA